MTDVLVWEKVLRTYKQQVVDAQQALERAIKMALDKGLSYREIGHATGVTADAVRMMAKRRGWAK